MKKHGLFFAVFAVLIFLGGCTQPVITDEPDISGPRKNIADAVNAINLHRNSVKPLYVNGSVSYIEFEDEKIKRQENMDCRLRFDPPVNLYFKASSVLGEAILLGSNSDEFWLRMKPKEISRYWWGNWAQLNDCPSRLLISPQNMLDALGMVEVDHSWILLNEKGEDVLVNVDDDGRFKKKIFIRHRDYLVSRIEYYNQKGIISISVDLDDYKPVDGGSPVPTNISIAAVNEFGENARIDVKLKTPKLFKPEQITKNMFNRPPSKGFKDIYKLNENCKYIQQ